MTAIPAKTGTGKIRAPAFAAVLILVCVPLRADPPASSYIFPAGGQQGTTVSCRVGALNCASECGFRMLDDSISAPARIERIDTLVLEGPYHQNPVAQLAWDYPKDMSAKLHFNDATRSGMYYWYCTTSEGATQLRPFIVGNLPEVIEDEEQTTAGHPQSITLPVTINGRIFPRADFDEYRFTAAAGTIVSCEVVSHRLGHKLDTRLELRDQVGQLIAEADDHVGPDSLLITKIPGDGEYVLRIHDIAFEGGQDYVYRLSLRTGPCVTHIYPAGANQQMGGKVRLYGPGMGADGTLDWQTTWNGDRHENAESGWSMPEGVNVFCPLPTSKLAQLIEAEPNDDDAKAQRITLPMAIHGRAQTLGDVDTFVFTAAEGENFVFDIFARRLVSPVTALVTVHNTAGEQIGRHNGDGPLYFAAPSAGDYTLRIGDLYRQTHAGDEYIYRVLAQHSPPDFQLHLATDNLGLEPGATTKCKLLVSRLGGFDGEVRLNVAGLPEGITLDTHVIPAREKGPASDNGSFAQNEIELSLTAAADAPIGFTARVKIVGTATIADTEVSHAAVLDIPTGWTAAPFDAGSVETGSFNTTAVDTLALTVTHPAVFSITTTDVYGSANRGATLVQTHQLKRISDFDGPVEISLSDGQDRYLQGVTGPTLTCQPNQTEFDYPAFLPETMDLARTARMVVMGVARVTDSSGRKHVVTHRTKNQMVVRICPSLLTLGAAKLFFEGTPGSTIKIPLRVGRTAEINGDVKLETVAAPDSTVIRSASVEVPPEVELFNYQVQLAPDASPGALCHLRLRATGLRDGYPAMAETAVEIQVVDAR
ncbi:MAG: hypothetical protein ABGX16_03295 [Pirellulales bacterium]